MKTNNFLLKNIIKMNEESNPYIKDLQYKYILHLMFYAIIIIFNFLITTIIIWIHKKIYEFYLLGTCIGIIDFIVPTISLIYIIYKKLTKNSVTIFRIVNYIFCGLSISLGLFFTVILMMNTIESPEFCKECPFNLPLQNLNKKHCEYRRCILDYQNSEQNSFYYLCNYNPISDFEEEDEDNKEIICTTFDNSNGKNTFQNQLIYRYLDFCTLSKEYYVCERFSKPGIYSLEQDFKCPEKNYLKILIIFSILNIIFNLIIGFIPWKMEISIYDKILMSYRQMRIRANGNNSINSTKNNSKTVVEGEGENNFRPTPTETIIICSDKGLNMVEDNKKVSNDVNKNNNINSINIYINKNININNIINNEIIINSGNEINSNNISLNNKEKNIIKHKNIKDKSSNLNINNVKYNLDLSNDNSRNKEQGKSKENDKISISYSRMSSERIDLDEIKK